MYKLSSAVGYSKKKDKVFYLKFDYIFLFALVSFLAFEVFSGALRYYLSGLGLAGLIYVPKAACLGLSLFYLVKEKSTSVRWVFLLFIPFSAAIALYNGATAKNLLLSAFFFSPLFFSIVAGSFFVRNRVFLWRVFLIFFVISSVGLILDMTTNLPWKGYSYLLNNIDLVANKQWSQLGEDRPSGFSRDSANLGIMISVFSLFVLSLSSRKIIIPVVLVSFFLIYATTYKTAIPAYLLSVMVLLLSRQFASIYAALLLVVGVLLPISSIVFSVSYGYDHSLLYSFVDRMANTWPGFFNQVVEVGTFLLGLGFGAVGRTAAVVPIHGINMTVADNTPLYLFGMFGLFGVFVYIYQLKVIGVIARFSERVNRPVMPVCIFLIVISWTTDLTESAIAMFYIGLIVSLAKNTSKGFVNDNARSAA